MNISNLKTVIYLNYNFFEKNHVVPRNERSGRALSARSTSNSQFHVPAISKVDPLVNQSAGSVVTQYCACMIKGTYSFIQSLNARTSDNQSIAFY